MLRSLRARLVTGLVALAAIGLLLLGGITYAEQRSFLYDRLDDQVRQAPMQVGRALASRDPAQSAGQPGGMPFGPSREPFGGGGPPPPGGPGGAAGGGGPDFGLPGGTFGELRGPNGTVIASRTFLLGTTEMASGKPKLPAQLPVGRIFTVGGTKSAGTRYRVLARPILGTNRTVVVALPLSEVDSTLNRLLLVEALVIAGVLAVIGVGAWIVVRLGLRPLDRMGRTAGAIAGGDLSHRVETTDPHTEVGRLGRALNAMLDRLERAFSQRRASEDRLRQFLADASHELRTPLASIRGYAELFRMGAASSPEETATAMRRIEEEAMRMGVLVEDLLTLARLDEIREAERARVDLAQLARDAVDDARATAPDREITLTSAPAGPAVVLGDDGALRQVLANLLRNALVHTPAGTPIEVSLAAGEDAAATAAGPATPAGIGDRTADRSRAVSVRLEVRDHGPGLPPGDPQALFGRFWRAERGRERGRGGAGLGLAIVAGVVEAAGGHVSASTVPDGGARFVVELPAADPPTGPREPVRPRPASTAPLDSAPRDAPRR